MVFLRTVVRSVVLVGLGAAWLQAQSTHVRVVASPQGRPRIAAVAPPPPPPSPSSYGPTVFSYDPLVVLPDGRVLVDLGTGYQQVASTCLYYVSGYGCLRYDYPIGSGYYYAPPVYVVPVYEPVAYPVPVYPSGGCAWGCGVGPRYVSPGWYPPWADPWSTSRRSASIPLPGPARAAPSRPPLGTVLMPMHGVKR